MNMNQKQLTNGELRCYVLTFNEEGTIGRCWSRNRMLKIEGQSLIKAESEGSETHDILLKGDK
jgi:hypothetical protein